MELIKFIARRLLNGILVLFGVVLVIFFLFNILPVNSARLTLGQRADVASLKQIEKEFHLNLPWYQRLGLYFNDLSPISINKVDDKDAATYLSPDDVKFKRLFSIGARTVILKAPYLGKSYQNRQRVTEMISEKLFPTFLLASVSMVIASILGIFFGTVSAVRQYTWIDNTIQVLTSLGISQPAYFSALIIAAVFGYYLGDFTHLNVSGPLIDVDLNGEYIVWKNLILPVMALSIRPIAIITQLTRSSMLDVLNQDYIRTARAKGLSYYSVVFKHALRNALNPVVTSISSWFAALLTGAYFIEKVFAYDGLGMLTINHLLLFDFPVVTGAVLLVALIFIVVNILTDILYSVLDPRVSVKG